MASPNDVAKFHAEYDVHPDDRLGLFGAVEDFTGPAARVLYPGSYVDIAPSVWFDHVTYIDVDKRAAEFFGNADELAQLVDSKRRSAHTPTDTAVLKFHHLDYRERLPEPTESFDLLISLYAGFVSEHCTNYLRVGASLLVNPSHGDAAMASIDHRYELAAAVVRREGRYRVSAAGLDSYPIPKREQEITVESLHESGRGVRYTHSPFAYVFTRTG